MYSEIIPAVGMGITEVEIISWKVKIGDKVNKGDLIVEIEMEKASAVLEASVTGVVKEILFKEGDIAEVGNVICKINEKWRNMNK